MKQKYPALICALILIFGLCACRNSNQASPNVDLTAFYESLLDNENFTANMPVEGQFEDSYYPGLKDIPLKQKLIYQPMISASVCEIALVEVENPDDVQTVADLFQNRIDYQVGTDTNPGGAFYPASIEGWKNNSRVVQEGNYVMLIAWEDCENVVSAFQALFS